MDKVIRFVCAECDKSVNERKSELINTISEWINSDAIRTMVSIFGGRIPDVDIKEKINWLNDFSNIWDYRKKQSNENERWNIEEDPIAKVNSGTLFECVKKLGLVDIEHPLQMPDYILPLGGARLSNYARPLKAKDIVDEGSIEGKQIVALSGTRPINEVEKPFIAEYAPEALTEFDAISAGVEKVFDLKKGDFEEEYHKESNINMEWAKRAYNEKYMNNTIVSIAAPSSDPARRANSRDTFEFFLDEFNISKGDRLLLVTSCIYVPFQLLKFMDLAIEKGFYVDCVGMPNDDKKGTAFSQISNYCQETRATINAIKFLADKWL